MMKRTLSILALSAALSITALADNWSGKLIDANCNTSQSPQAGQNQSAQPPSAGTPPMGQSTTMRSCDATSATTTFALDVAGKVYKLDAAGNSKAVAALRDRADRSSDPAAAQETHTVNAKVVGNETGGTISVTSIEVQ